MEPDEVVGRALNIHESGIPAQTAGQYGSTNNRRGNLTLRDSVYLLTAGKRISRRSSSARMRARAREESADIHLPLIEKELARVRRGKPSFPEGRSHESKPRRAVVSPHLCPLHPLVAPSFAGGKRMIASRMDVEGGGGYEIGSATEPTRARARPSIRPEPLVPLDPGSCSACSIYARISPHRGDSAPAVVICPSRRAVVDIKPEANYVLRYKSTGHTPFASPTGYHRHAV